MRHLAARFFGALSPAGPPENDERWAQAYLVEGERSLWRRMSGPDRRHAVGVARDAIQLLGPGEPDRGVVAAALLHDVGKVEAGIGTFGRAGVTLIAMVVGRARLLRWSPADPPATRPPRRARIGMYLAHDRLGAMLLAAAGSDPLTVAWAAEHHLAAASWSVDATVAAALKAADGD